jgi:hypothetical protein
MSDTHSGGCLCAAVRYEFSVEPLFAGHCHCRQCQRATGSPYTTILAIEEKDFNLLQGELKSFSVRSAADREVTRLFCPTCGSPLFTKAEMAPGMIFIKVASLDDSSWVEPQVNCWTNDAPHWSFVPPNLQDYAENP